MRAGSRESRIAALGVLSGVVSLLIVVLVLPVVQSYSDKIGKISRMEDNIARYQGVVGQLPTLVSYSRKVKAALPDSGYFLPGDTAALASASLQQYVRQTTQGVGGTLISTQTLPDALYEGVSAVSVKIRVRSDLKAMISILHKLETSKPMLFVDNLMVMTVPKRQFDAKAGEEDGYDLDYQLTLTGFSRKGVS
ncbi:MAG: hypothetical protein GC138_08385 [Gammaproteobacteria bacterium]|nr:hypothetical protein [Gammaproteobacteria bacterium]